MQIKRPKGYYNVYLTERKYAIVFHKHRQFTYTYFMDSISWGCTEVITVAVHGAEIEQHSVIYNPCNDHLQQALFLFNA